MNTRGWVVTGEGWVLCDGSGRAHYCIDGHALCGNAVVWGEYTFIAGGNGGDCYACRTKLAKRAA